MKRFKYAAVILTVFSFILLVFSQPAYAYLDPGSGSYLIQIAIASFLGGLYLLKVFWSKIKLLFANIFTRGRHE
jgi:hypothetical protein